VTVQGALQAALHRVLGEAPLPQGSGRTDAGVHALGQVASFALEAPIPAGNLERALNRTLPAAIRVLHVEPVPENFQSNVSNRSPLRGQHLRKALPQHNRVAGFLKRRDCWVANQG